MAPPISRPFVEWGEKYVSKDRGSRVVHYYLIDRHGNTKLAVVGTERSLRHMVYVVSEEFMHLTNNSKSSSSSSMKWRSRREVVDWLSSLLPKSRPASSEDHITNITSPQKTRLCLCCRGYCLGQTLFLEDFYRKKRIWAVLIVKPFPIQEPLMDQIYEFLICEASSFISVVLKVPRSNKISAIHSV